MAELSDYLKLGKEPVSPQSPAGEPVDFDDRLEQLKIEIRKLESVNQIPVNWGTVVELSSELLKKSKTFSLGPYLALGLLETKGYAGLSTGLELCRDLIKNFWETGFPPPARLCRPLAPFAPRFARAPAQEARSNEAKPSSSERGAAAVTPAVGTGVSNPQLFRWKS